VFQLSLVEHIRLSGDSMMTAYEAHAQAATRLARQWWYARVLTLALAAATAILTGIALQQGRPYAIAAAVSATAALAACAAYVAFDPSPRIYGHRASAARLWLLADNYRALLAEVQDELIDVPGIRERRHALAREAAAIFEQAPPGDRHAYEIARKSLREVDAPTRAA
jgi:conflict system pore-forming effector with SLATT domain